MSRSSERRSPHALLTAVFAATLTGGVLAPLASGVARVTAEAEVAEQIATCEARGEQLAWLRTRVALARSLSELDAGNLGLAADHLAQAQALAGTDPRAFAVHELSIDIEAARAPQRRALAAAIRTWDDGSGEG